MEHNNFTSKINKILAHLKLAACSIILLWLGYFFTIIILLSYLSFGSDKLFVIVAGVWLMIGIFWQIRIILLLWRKNVFVTQCSQSQHKVKYKNAIFYFDYPNYYSFKIPMFFFLSAEIPVTIVTIMVLLFPISKVGYCPTCNEIKVQCPYCKQISPIDEVANNHFKCPHCGKTNRII